ncbi:unnamed protein product [Effrenium voratum]|nr:unnamed protein product [Effrenium voratum]
MPPFPWPPCRSSQRMQTAWTLPWISSPLNRSRRSPAGTSTLLRGPVVGRLKEYDGWDFSEIEKEAWRDHPSSRGGNQKLFGLEEKKEEPKQSSEPVMFRKGDKVKLLDLEDEALNGKTGKLLSLVVGTGKFAIELDDSDGADNNTVYVKPKNIKCRCCAACSLSLRGSMRANLIIFLCSHRLTGYAPSGS